MATKKKIRTRRKEADIIVRRTKSGFSVQLDRVPSCKPSSKKRRKKKSTRRPARILVAVPNNARTINEVLEAAGPSASVVAKPRKKKSAQASLPGL